MSKKVMLITGASRGIGAAIAIEAAKKDYFVVVNYTRSKDEADQVVTKIKSMGGESLAIQADCSKEEDIVRLFKEVDAIGKIDTLVANAGIIGGKNPIEETSSTQLRELFELNVMGLILCSREAVKRMSTKHGGLGGNIILMSSVSARTGGIAGEIHYASSKAAVDGFNLGLAKEVGGAGIRVNSVRPGLIGTAIHDVHGGIEEITKWAPTVPMTRIGTPDEVAKTVLWLCSDAASYVHGAFIDISGGR
jgi:NAD(P)-dependent dehydrogenase (short-subunit alcohol dehydrogenase family)